MCCTPAVNNKRHERLRDALEWGVALACTLEERQNSVRFGARDGFQVAHRCLGNHRCNPSFFPKGKRGGGRPKRARGEAEEPEMESEDEDEQ